MHIQFLYAHKIHCSVTSSAFFINWLELNSTRNHFLVVFEIDSLFSTDSFNNYLRELFFTIS